MIENTNLARVRMMNFYQAMDDIITYLNKEDLETLKLKDPVKAFSDNFHDFDKIIQPMRESGLATACSNSTIGATKHWVSFRLICVSSPNTPKRTRPRPLRSSSLFIANTETGRRGDRSARKQQ